MNKTATVSTHNLLKVCGINSVHSTKSPLDLAKKFDAFNDGNHVNKFKEYYNHYPDALFLLNTRPLQDWIFSRFKHGIAESKRKRQKVNWAYPASEKLALSWIDKRRQHHHSVLDFFKDKPSQLLVCNIENPVWQKTTLKFLKVDKEIPSIVLNTSNIKYSNIQNVINNLKYNKNELLFPDFDPINYSMLQIYLKDGI
jgi:hypothetical protein